jgi:hypothetical protein
MGHNYYTLRSYEKPEHEKKKKKKEQAQGVVLCVDTTA